MTHRPVIVLCMLICLAGLQLPGSPGWAQGAGDEALLEELAADYEQAGDREVSDPLETWNRAVFSLNDKLYLYLLQPTARGYATVVPEEIRTGVRNVFNNVQFPLRLVNSLLQGKWTRAAQETGSFLINSSVGVLGLLEVSKTMPGLSADLPREDTGQTLGVWGCPEGVYLVWPVLGPSNVRDTLGRIGDYFLNPLSYLDSLWLRRGLKAGERINAQSFNPDEYEEMKQGTLDPYTAFQDGYLQFRRKQIQQ